MALLRVDQWFATLNTCSTFSAVLPDAGPVGEVPVVYLLHGVQDDGTGWLRFTAAERYARLYNVALVVPNAGNSFYAHMAAGPDYFAFVTEELPAQCRRLFGLSGRREDNYVFGLSMGGYGALKCALTYPERYAGCAAFSTAVRPAGLAHAEPSPLSPAEWRAVFGPRGEPGPECDLFALAGRAAGGDLPHIHMACGTGDPLYPDNLDLHRHLTEKGIRHTFRSRPGTHAWTLWDQELEYALDAFFGTADTAG